MHPFIFEKHKLVILFVGCFFLFNKIVFSSDYSDVNKRHWAYHSVNSLIDRQILPGKGKFSGNSYAERGFVFELMYNIITGRTSDEFNRKMDFLLKKGLVKGRGRSGNIDLHSTITRYETATLLNRISKHFDVVFNRNNLIQPAFSDIPENHWARASVDFAFSRELMKGYPNGDFRGNGMITRYETAVLFFRLLKNLKVISMLFSEKLIMVCEKLLNEGRLYKYGEWDCSLFVKQVWDAFNIPLPRSSKLQAKQGEAVMISKLQPGDLVFFDFKHQPPYEVNHVGIYVGKYKADKNCFFHNSISAGKVVYADIMENWAKKSFLYGRRVRK